MIMQELEMSHPIPIVRCSEINEWAKSQDYRDLLNGKYIRGKVVGGKLKAISNNASGPIAKLCTKCHSINEDTKFCFKCRASLSQAPWVYSTCQVEVTLT